MCFHSDPLYTDTPNKIQNKIQSKEIKTQMANLKENKSEGAKLKKQTNLGIKSYYYDLFM